jgi:hypothetical protein
MKRPLHFDLTHEQGFKAKRSVDWLTAYRHVINSIALRHRSLSDSEGSTFIPYELLFCMPNIQKI